MSKVLEEAAARRARSGTPREGRERKEEGPPLE